MAQFSLVGLVPEPDTFQCPDGTVYEVKKGSTMSIVQYAAFERLHRMTQPLLAKLNAATDDTKAAVAVEVDQHVNALIAALMPTMPAERIDAIPISEKFNFIAWWRKQQETATPGEAPAGQQQPRPQRGRRSPASSTPTA